ncbi:MAG: nucleotidyl transferase AbiEii/AbiGii toxin family protein [Desulfobacterales bacterium]
MSPSKTKNYAASVRQRLLNYARSSGQDFIFVLRTFAMERLLYRLSRSPYVDNFVLKGAMLFKLWTGDFYRQTRDIDVLAFKSETIDSLKAVFQEISQISFADDGLTYLSNTVGVNEIREEQQYGGLRVKLTATLGSAKIYLQVDCGFGDAITPEPIVTDFPTLLDFPAPQLHTYPKETVVAEKFEAIVRLGMATSRMKDFYDIWVLASDFPFSGQIIASAIQNTFNRRKTSLPAGTPEVFQASFIQNPLKQTQWQAFVQKTSFVKVEKDFGKTIDFVRSFLLPPIDFILTTKSFKMNWSAGGPWLDKKNTTKHIVE